MFKFVRSHLVLLIMLLACTDYCSANDAKFAEFVVTSFQDSRERLRSGHFVCSRTRNQESMPDPVKGSVCNVDVWFDHDARSELFKCMFTNPAKQEHSAPNGGMYVRKEKQAVLWLDGWSQVQIVPLSKEVPSRVWTPDVRTIGIANFGEFHAAWDFNKVMSLCQKRNSQFPVTTSRPSDGIVRLEWVRPKTKKWLGDTIRVDFDVMKGYLPVSFETAWNDQPGSIHDWGLVEWVEMNGVWVPKKATVANGEKGKWSDRLDMVFDWKSVNAPVNPNVFMIREMGVPNGVQILDTVARPDRPVNLGKIGDMTPHPRLALMEPPDPRRWWQSWTIAAAAIALLAALAFGVRTWLRRSRKPETPS